MNAPINVFEDRVETGLIAILQEVFTRQGVRCRLTRGESDSKKTYPLCTVSSSDGEEAIFQTAIWRLTVEVIVECDVDTSALADSAAIFGAVLDVLQDRDLILKLEAAGRVKVKGFVFGTQRVNELGDRLWSKTATADVFGYCEP